jgi:hypothetical protein
MVYFMMLLVSTLHKTTSNFSMIDELNEFGRKRSWSNHGTLLELEQWG